MTATTRVAPLPPDATPVPTMHSDSTGGAPSWVKAGVRLTWYQGAASVAQSRYSWVEDPSGPYVDAKTGTHYRRTDESGEGQGTSSGDGVSQLDILAVNGGKVSWTDALWANNTAQGGWAAVGSTGGTSTGAPLGSWIDPAQISGLTSSAQSGLLVLTGPYPLQGKTYQSVSFVNPDPNAYASYTYDTETGVLLAATTSTAGATSSVAGRGRTRPRGTPN